MQMVSHSNCLRRMVTSSQSSSTDQPRCSRGTGNRGINRGRFRLLMCAERDDPVSASTNRMRFGGNGAFPLKAVESPPASGWAVHGGWALNGSRLADSFSFTFVSVFSGELNGSVGTLDAGLVGTFAGEFSIVAGGRRSGQKKETGGVNWYI